MVSTPPSSASTRLVALLAPVLVAAIVIVNAWPGLMPGVGFWDTGEFQTVLPIMGTAHPTGYPTYVLLGFVANLLLAPIGEPAFRINALSLIAVAVAAGATAVLVRRLTGSTIIGVAIGLGLATTPVVWANATRADPHPIHLVFVALLLLALVRWEDARRELREAAGEIEAEADAVAGAAANTDAASDAAPAEATPSTRTADRRLVVAAIVFGLAAGNHSLILLFVPPIVLYVLAVEPGILVRFKLVLACLVAALGAAALVFLELPIRGGILPAPLVYGTPATWDGFWYIALAEQFRGSLGDPFDKLGVKLDTLVDLTTSQLGLVAYAIPPAFLIAVRRAPRYTLLTAATLLITVLFNLAYSNADIQRYYLGPVLIIWTWIGILAAEVADIAAVLLANLAPGPRPISFDSRVVRRASTVAAAIVGVVLLLPTITELDVRRHAEGIDRTGEVGAAQWLGEALPAVAQDAILVSWWSASTPLWYAQKVQGLRPDIDIIDDRTMLDRNIGRAPDVIRNNLGKRPVYVIRLEGRDTDELTRQFAMTAVAGGGNLTVWRVDGILAATP